MAGSWLTNLANATCPGRLRLTLGLGPGVQKQNQFAWTARILFHLIGQKVVTRHSEQAARPSRSTEPSSGEANTVTPHGYGEPLGLGGSPSSSPAQPAA